MWTKGSDATMDITVGRSVDDDTTLARFVGVRVDGAALTDEDFDVSAGSLHLSIRPAFLETLATGTHTLLISFTDGDAPEMTFTV